MMSFLKFSPSNHVRQYSKPHLAGKYDAHQLIRMKIHNALILFFLGYLYTYNFKLLV